MSNVIFNGVEIRYLDVRRDEGGVFSRIHIAFNPSDPVMEAMGWDPWPDSIPRGPLTGRLAGTHVIITPTDKSLKQHEVQFGVNEVRDFSFTSETNDDGHIIARTIRATLVSAERIAALIENYLSIVGEASAVAKIGYTAQPSLPGTEPVVDDKQKVMTFQKKQQAGKEDENRESDEAANVGLNNLNAAGSGRTKAKNRRGNPVEAPIVAIDADERARLEKVIDESLH